MTRIHRQPGGRARRTSEQTAAAFIEMRRRRNHPGKPACCARFVFGDGKHEVDCNINRPTTAGKDSR